VESQNGDLLSTLTCIVKPDGDQWSALCLELDVAGCGDTKQEAIQNLHDAVETYLQYMRDTGRDRAWMRPVPLEAIRQFLTGEAPLGEIFSFEAFAMNTPAIGLRRAA